MIRAGGGTMTNGWTMKSHVQVVVIGGGVVGCSVLYHLTKAGWRDVVLIERSELTSGSSWHAAGNVHTFNLDSNVARLQQYTIKLYEEIEAISGQSCGLHVTGGLMLASTEDRLDWLKQAHARSRYLEMETQLVSPSEAARMFPLMDKKYFVGALYDPIEGHADPAGVTNAYAKAARTQGAEVYRFTRVIELAQRRDGWDVVTDKGTIHTEHVVNAGGLWAREVGRMVGLELPVLAMEHQYIITEEIPEVKASAKEMLHVIDFEGEIYMRQEGNGMLLGTYERAGVPWSEQDTPWDFTHELLPPDLERIAPSLEVAFRHYPLIERAGIRKVINGPFTFAPDGNPVIGPVRGRPNYWVACGVMAGFCQGGGVGLTLSNWMVHGDPGLDIWAMDVARFGDWTTRGYTNAKVRENYSRRFRIRFPNEELPAARPLRTSPVYDRLKQCGAVFGDSFGLEHALWFAPAGSEASEEITFRRSNAHAPVGEECRAVRNAVGLMETSSYSKYVVTGTGAEAWLSKLMANRIPVMGRIVLAPMLNPQGKLIGDFTVAKLADQRFYLFGSGIAEGYHMRWFEALQPAGGVAIRSLRSELTGFSIAGPNSRELLRRLVATDVSNEAFPFLSFRTMDLGTVPAMVGRVTFTGDLGYEVWVSADYQRTLYDLLVATGRDLGLRHFGARALHALRLEKSFGTWAREFRPIYGPFEAGLDRFVDFRKGDFIGRDAALKEKEIGPNRRLVTFVVDAAEADCVGDEPVWHDGKVVGWITSGAFCHHVGKSLALGYIPAKLGSVERFELEILGERRAATPITQPVFDPDGKRMRS
jgi:dimethylglycine dehydrogenase